MKKPNALVVTQIGEASALVKIGDARSAQTALVAIADKHGDKALMSALDNVPPADLGRILVGTATQPSAIVGHLVTPAQFLTALKEVPKTWSNSINPLHAALELSELFVGVVMRQNHKDVHGADASKFIKLIEGDEVATLLFVWWAREHEWQRLLDKPVQENTPDPLAQVDEVSDDEEGDDVTEVTEAYVYNEGDWDHLITIVKNNFGGLFEKIKNMKPELQDLLPSVIEMSEADEMSAL